MESALALLRDLRRLRLAAESEDELLAGLCSLLVTRSGLLGACASVVEGDPTDPTRRTFRGVRTAELADPALEAVLRTDEGGAPLGPLALTAIETGAPTVATASGSAARAVACVPLRCAGELMGLLALHGPVLALHPPSFALLRELADDAAAGLRALRAVAAERRRAEQEARLARAERDAILAACDDGFVRVSAGRITEVNQAFCRLLGYAREELLGERIDRLSPPPRGLEALGALADAAAYRARGRLGRGDGQLVDVELSAAYLPGHGGQAGDVVAFARDVSEEVRSAEALRETQARLYRVLDSAPIVLSAVDARGVYTLCEGRLPEGDGRDLVGVSALEADDPLSAAAWRRALAGEESTSLLPVAGRLVEARFAPVRSPDGEVTGALSVKIDVTDREVAAEALRRTEAQSRRYREQFLQAQKLEAVGRLAGGVAHDFNNLLCAINGYADLLVRELGDSPLREDAAEISAAGLRAATLTRQLLTFARRDRPVLEVLDLAEVVHNVSRLIQRVVGELVTVRTELGRALVRADRAQIEQVVMNLAVNARDAMPEGGVLTLATGIAAEGEPAAQLAWLRVADTGCGMSEEVRAHLFEPFFTTKERGRGTGLGLSTVYGIVQGLEGRIDVQTAPGKGTSLTALLPLSPEQELRPGAEPLPPPPVRAEGTTVLVAEDEAAVRGLVCRVLTDRGYQVLQAADGAEALRICGAHSGAIDVVLADVVMPGMSAAEMGRALQRMRPGARLLHMSGYSDGAGRAKAEDEDVPLLPKPFQPDELLRAVEALLRAPAGP